MYKLSNNIGPNSLSHIFTYKSEKKNYNHCHISNSLCLPPPPPFTNCMKKASYSDNGPSIWNSFPQKNKRWRIPFCLSEENCHSHRSLTNSFVIIKFDCEIVRFHFYRINVACKYCTRPPWNSASVDGPMCLK